MICKNEKFNRSLAMNLSATCLFLQFSNRHPITVSWIGLANFAMCLAVAWVVVGVVYFVTKKGM